MSASSWIDAARPHDCATCSGFQYEQLAAGRFSVCRTCCGSGRDDVLGDRPAGLVVRDSSAPDSALVRLPYTGTRSLARRADDVPTRHDRDTSREVAMPRTAESAERERERKRLDQQRRRDRARIAAEVAAASAAQQLEDAEREHEPIVVEIMPLHEVCAEASRQGHAIAARVERVAADLHDPSSSSIGHHDLWRFEAEIAAAMRELREVGERCRAWRALRDAEVEQASR